MVTAHFFEVVLIKGAVDDATVVAGGALGLHSTRVAGCRVSPIDYLFLGVLGLATREALPLRTAVGVLLRIVGERALPEERGPAIEIGQGEERPDPGVLNRHDVLNRAVGRVAGDLSGTQLAAEADPPQQVAQRHVLP